jgi:hypothetical protein
VTFVTAALALACAPAPVNGWRGKNPCGIHAARGQKHQPGGLIMEKAGDTG